MIWIGLVLFLICTSISLYSAWQIFQLRCFVSTSNGYYKGYELSLENYYNVEESLLEALEKSENWFKKGWLSVLQFVGWLLAIPLWTGNNEVLLAVWIPCVFLGSLGFSKIKQNTIDICYLVLRQHQERKILKSDLSAEEKVKFIELVRK